MKRTDSLRDVSAVVHHFPTYLEKRVATESFLAEALNYAAWLPLAAGARYLGWHSLAYLFLTWFILGEMLNVYVRQSFVRFRWWQVLAGVLAAHAYFGAELTLDRNSYWRFLVYYIIGGILFLAATLPLVPKRFLRGFSPATLGLFGYEDVAGASGKATKSE